ncbi:MAG: NAD(+)/NADH kinase [Veillonella caviae]|uniref:NAD(+)/NADH kinase n=1 Tax=Veillonella caviae TaxID=248316 RepID=UPI002A9134AE|nr:NAD(+)/NADH kinase [Veillonella caviae]MDY5481575.1 NAD(+)/NADH kinase [Veillonella caviae]
MRIGFFPNMGKSNIMAVLKMAAHICKEEQIDVYVPDDLEIPDTYKKLQLPKERVLPRPEIFKNIDVAFSFGGDGTIIHLARQIYSYNVPVCGINLGELGFLNQIEIHQLHSHIKRIVEGDYTIEKRGHLHAYINREDGSVEDLIPIINEIVITRAEPAKMARINLAINDYHTQMYPADGLIIASATGSTGYNLSAGGPIMKPDNRSIIVTPIAPHLIQDVSMVLEEKDTIQITMPEREPQLHICIDGTFDYVFTNKEILHISSNPVYCQFLRFKDQCFFGTLFKKLASRRDELL